MENNDTPENVEPNEEPEGEELELKCLLRKDISFIPMDTNDSMTTPGGENTSSDMFTSEKVFKAVSQGNAAELHGLLDYLQRHNKRLTSPEFTDETNGKTALLKALLNLKDGRNDTIEVILDIADKTEDLENLIIASYIDPYYKGQTALHVAIERRSFDHVKLLVQKGADVQAKANGKFFQRTGEMGFYFGELPLSLAACTNQPDIVSFLMENPYRRADVTDRDSQGNTVLHTLVVIADNTKENTDMIAKVYDEILVQHNKLDNKVQLEEIENNKGLTPLKLAAKLGKIELFRHMLHREFMDKETRPLSRKVTEWVYGPVHSSLYDITSIDTNEKDSVLAIIIFGSDIPNRPEMLQIEPLRSLLQDKWETFALKLFLMNFLLYVVYLTIFTVVTLYRKDGKPPFPIENFPLDHLHCVGEVLSVFGALIFLYKTINNFWRNPPNFKVLSIDGLSDILFFLQAALLLICVIMYGCGQEEYVGLLVLSLALAWVNLLHYLRGSRQLGMYSVMMQRMILRDLLHFLSVYCVLLFGFSAAFVALIRDSPPVVSAAQNLTADMQLQGGSLTASVNKLSNSDVRFTILELFKFTIGMGDLQFTDDVQYKEVYYILLISYIVLTYILLLNMLIALMGNTVERLSKQSENIWNLQRAFTILDMERSLPKPLRHKLLSRSSKMVSSRNSMDTRKFFRVEEMNWKQWKSDLSVNREEEPANLLMKSQPHGKTTGIRRPVNLLLKKIRNSREHQQQSYIP